MPKPSRIGHLVINAKDLDAATKFYTDVIGFEIALERPGFGTFLTCGQMHHDLAIFQAPEGSATPKDGDVGLNHMAIEVADYQELTDYYHKLQEYFETSELQLRIREGYTSLLSGREEMPTPFDMGAVIGPILNEGTEGDFRRELTRRIRKFVHARPEPLPAQADGGLEGADHALRNRGDACQRGFWPA